MDIYMRWELTVVSYSGAMRLKMRCILLRP